MKSPLSPTKGRLAVLLYESSEAALNAYVKAFQHVFKIANYDVEIYPLASGQGNSQGQENLFQARYLDVVISDVSFGDIKNQMGLHFLTSIKESHPDIFTIAFTGRPISYQTCSANHQFDLYIDKTRIVLDQYQKFIASQLTSQLRINPHAEIKGDRNQFWPGIKDAQWIDLQRLVRRITYSGPPRPEERTHISSVRLEPIDGGMSGAKVFSVLATTGTGQKCIHAVLKVALQEDRATAATVKREISNYDSMVRWHLPYHWRPELLGSSNGGNLVGLCYAFVSSQEAPFETLRQYIHAGKLDVVSDAIKSIFHPERKRWYGKENLKKDESLTGFYLNHCFIGGRFERELETFRHALRTYDTSGAETVQINGMEVQFPNIALFATPAGPCQTCLIHGDLNTGNVFLARTNTGADISLIDFASAGRGHVFYDFIVFEVNLRLDHREEEPFSIYDRILEEQKLNQDDGRSKVPFSAEIIMLRHFAANNFPTERFNNYLYGLSAFCFSLMTAKNLSEIDRKILSACISAALVDLKARKFWTFN